MRSACVEFEGSKNRGGYGHLHIDKQLFRAHRLAYRLFNGIIPKGIHVLHSCDNRACINPHHLWLGTNASNMMDMKQKGRAKGKHLGEQHGRSKLNEKQVLCIKRNLGYGNSKSSLARLFNVSHATIGRIANGTAWAWLDLPPSTNKT